MEPSINLLEEINSVSKIHTLHREDIDALMIEFARRICASLRIERMSVWLFNKKHDAIISIGEYDLETKTFQKESMLLRIRYPAYFKAISENEILLVEDIIHHPATSELAEDYSIPNGLVSLMDIPLRIGGELIGVMCFEKKGKEKRIFSRDEKVFALSTGAVLSSNLEARYRRALQFKLDKEVRTKNLLIKEINHRVKNNLLVVSGLLNLQANKSKDAYHAELFEYIKSKINSIASIHEIVYQSKSLSEISTKKYFSKMLNDLIILNSARENKIAFNSRIKDIPIDLDIAISLALIVNEVITNAFKHAFNQKENAKLDFELDAKGKEIILRIYDNGKGMPTAKGHQGKLGLDIIQGLADQLDATYTYEGTKGKGTEFRLAFQHKKRTAITKINKAINEDSKAV